MLMPTISITDARKNIFELADKSKEAASPILVVNSRGSNFVIVSEDDWNDIQETLALASVPGFGETIKKAKKEDYSKKKPYSENEKW
jgi:antitoxin YefM